MDENIQKSFPALAPGIGPEKIENADKERQVKELIKLIEEKGIEHAEKVAKKLDDHYVLGRFYEEAAKVEKQKAKEQEVKSEEKK